MNKLVTKRTIKRIADTIENEELCSLKLSIELARESNDEMFKELIMLHLDDMEILNSEDGEKIKRDFDRILSGIQLCMI